MNGDGAQSWLKSAASVSAELRPWLDAAIAAWSDVLNTIGRSEFSVLDVCPLPSGVHVSYVSLEGESEIHLIGAGVVAEQSATLVAELFGLPEESIRDDAVAIADGMGELANMIAGGVKSRLSVDGDPLTTGLPISGSDIQPHGAIARAAVRVCWNGVCLHIMAMSQALPSGVIERRRMMNDIKDREERLAAIWRTAAEGIITVDSSDVIETINPAGEEIFGRQGVDLIGRQIAELIPDWGQAELVAGAAPSTEAVRARETIGKRTGGADVPLEVSVSHFLRHRRIMYAVIVRDITARKAAQAELDRVHRQLAEMSRQAGMAEIAADVLHSLGNSLNSVSTAAATIRHAVRKSKISHVAAVSKLLTENHESLASFLTSDERGKLLPDYLEKLGAALAEEHEELLKELDDVTNGIQQIAGVVQRQQQHAQGSSVLERLRLEPIIERSLQSHRLGTFRQWCRWRPPDAGTPPVLTDHSKTLRVLEELLANAVESFSNSTIASPEIDVRLFHGQSGYATIEIADNGEGIPAEKLTAIFMQGYTTKPGRRGMGLHDCALTAKGLGGSLEVNSDGPGKGTAVRLTLPTAI